MDILSVWDEANQQWVGIPAIQGEVGPQGPQGNSGVYYGSNTPPTGTKVWIDPNGEPSDIVSGVITQLAGGGTFNYECYKRESVVTFYAHFTGGSTTGSATYFQLPEGFRPPVNLLVPIVFKYANAWTTYVATIGTNGQISLAYGSGAVTQATIFASFVVGG